MNVFYLICSIFNTRRMSVYSRWWKETETMLFIFIFITLAHLQSVDCADDVLRGSESKTPQSGRYREADITISYKDKKNKDASDEIQGKFGLNSVTREVKGIVMYAESTTKKNKKNHLGCKKYDNKLPSVKWIALVERGDCEFSTKVKIATKYHNASAVVVYDGSNKETLAIMNQGEKNSISIFIANRDGLKIVSILRRGSSVMMNIVPGKEVPFDSSAENNISKTSVLFVSISFIVLMIISLAWLVFYYIQRFRYSHAKERLARRLACAAKKAIAKIPQSTVKSGDKVLEGDHDQCAVCIEQYKLHDVIRILPCSHVFHKSCVDPWLQENRSCPMCKMDILVAYGMQIGTSQESVHHNAEPGPTTQLVIEDPEVSSSVDDGVVVAPEEVVLPFICLHKNMEGDDDDDDDDDAAEAHQPTSQLLGTAVGVAAGSSVSSCEEIRLSSMSLHSTKSGGAVSLSSLSRVEKRDKEESKNIERIALIEKDHNEEDDDDDDEDEKVKVDSDKIEYIKENESRSCSNDKSKSKSKKKKENKDLCVSSSNDKDLNVDDLSSSKRDNDDESVTAASSSSAPDSRSNNKDTSSIIILETGGGDSVGAVEFHHEQDLSPSTSFSHAC